ncbi:MAG: ribonuclease HII [Deltaproteobacteria bacterium]|nr:ribonuclease HII [Deltaproteobacteria bacterium]
MATRKEQLWARHHALLEEERALWARGLTRVGGLDEAGAGPWAGPVMAACVVVAPEATDALIGVFDSKQLSAKKRTELAALIKEAALASEVAEASVEEIDTLNIRRAGLLAMERALLAVEAKLGPLEYLLLDARTLALARPQRAIIKGDAKSISIAAASILAKVTRDALMTKAAERYPEYGFEQHKGYGTAAHKKALARFGACPIHRRSFEPVREASGGPPDQRELFSS